jgi:transcriptional regulator with XRE-family HTH domain
MDIHRIGKLIRDRRTEKQLTQEELSERSGVAVSTICSIENGTHVPMASTLAAILGELGDDLLNDL